MSPPNAGRGPLAPALHPAALHPAALHPAALHPGALHPGSPARPAAAAPGLLGRAGALAGLAVALASPALADDDDEFMKPDRGGARGGVEVDAPAGPVDNRWTWTWPESAHLDTAAGRVGLRWADTSGPAVEDLALDDIIRFERARPYESSPDELFALLADGRRVLLSRGADVPTHAVLARAITSIPLKEMAPGAGHFSGSAEGRPPPVLRIGGGHGVIYRSAARTDLALAGGGADERPLRTVASDDHPALAGQGGGSLERHEIEAVFKQKMGLFIRCYQRELQRNPALRGKVVVRFVVDREGSVAHAHLRATSIENAVVEECVVDEVKRTRFPRPEGGGSVVVSYPLNFEPL